MWRFDRRTPRARLSGAEEKCLGEGWRDALRAGLPADKQRLLDGVETTKISPRL
jgi:hypothetical protein